MAKDLLLEIGLEEMPAHVVTPSRIQLEEKVIKFLDEHHLDYETVQSFATPRRLAVKVTAIPEKQVDVEEEVKGPAKKIALDAEGNWSKAAQGFVRGQGVTTEDIVFKELNGVEYVYVTKFTKGQSAKEVLTKLNDVITSLTFPVTMHWANYDFEYIRPIHWIVALLDDEVIPFKVLDVTTGQTSRGHRFLGDDVTFQHANEYEAKLKEQFVVVQPNERKQMIVDQANALAAEKNWQLALDEELLEEVTNLVEYPTAFVGSFDEKYLSVPDEVLVTSMKEHQRYFEVRNDQGLLMPHFIAVRNGDNVHLENVIKGNEKVLIARLEDAEFFYNEDKKLTIEACVEKLKNVTFHEKIGSIYEKMQRVALIAQIIGRKVGLSEEELEDLKRASEIYKFDLVTNMVGEFPELQGIMGEKYALLQGEKPAVATAIREHYLPTSSEGELPETAIGAVLALADKLDSVFSFFSVGMIPTGSNDPYALRRQTYGVIRIIEDKGWTFPLVQLQTEVDEAVNQDVEKYGVLLNEGQAEVVEFVKARLRQLLMTKNVRHDIIDAVVSAEQADLSKLFASANILKSRFEDQDFKPSMEALTRVINLAKKGQELLGDTEEGIDPSLFENKAEKELYQAVNDLSEAFATRTIAENYEALVNLRPLIDAYFNETMVMVEDEKVKQNRLKQLMQIAKMALSIASLDLLIVK
ncbi:TPA: glycine--tRNA ligase subunit beta [Enterococcus faecalis]|uniref:glycine--tRNA ligase subunit beta n=1 Tax=Enterococcus TaxID=1350 RepID=UPI0001B2BD94|nr:MULTISPECIES: glycine--tRNA ligase subunit beta [Enterococcus]ETJ09296.1 MAG: Glycine-tRNA ligase beta subunit [Enterococcus faecalis DORA_14]HAP3745986.1 glycine--tRNA ligase subunit beta [Enterococcus faecalis TDR28]HAP3751964.1 glycine--tRNA ligase subunit beta [Enterococcus faecalis TDR22]HAP3754760.1 glycine--tRNA ligase subunit beta [Enterococcus faecalis TDR13]HAP3757980.1 glycine--tRNA ligase subunit beta [Enterococcus faecalis TDR7]HAP3769157.1 glycine--tRNA ligase subunit beta [E